jgi:OPA family glycerol-3-phosphate transporter-like MFS transporter/OPA family sugar phosphate sensor protein UhpC-like MFS transporter
MKLFDDPETNRRFHRTQWRMLFATMIGYTLFYFMRKNFSFAMPGLEQDCGISKAMLGNFLFAGGIVYGISKFLNGIIGDRCNSRKMLCFGLLACTLVNVAFGFAPQIAAWMGNGEWGTGNGEGGMGNGGQALAWIFGILLVLNQFFQGTGFPPCAKLIAFWVPPKELATKMSVWNTSHSIGGGLVAKVCGVIMGLGVIGSANQGVGMWKWCFWSMAILGLLGLVAMWFTLPGTPKEEGLPDLPGTEASTSQPLNPSTPQPLNSSTPQHPNAPSALRMVFLNPVIWMLGLCNFSINAARALVADWGPTLLQEAKGLTSSEAGTAIMLFEFAGIAGMLFAGWATDRLFGGRAPRLCVFLMALTAGLMAMFWFLPAGGATGVLAVAALCLAGFTLYGPQALTGVTATNTSTKLYAGTSIGFISLFSYVGVAVSGKVCGSLAQSSGGWHVPVLAIVGVAAVGCALFVCLWNVRANSYGEK